MDIVNHDSDMRALELRLAFDEQRYDANRRAVFLLMIMLFIVLSRNKLRIPLEGTSSSQRSYRTAIKREHFLWEAGAREKLVFIGTYSVTTALVSAFTKE